jgi:hypothetical protein
MMHILPGAQLLAAWSIRLNISWWRFLVAMAVLAGMVYVAAYVELKKK